MYGGNMTLEWPTVVLISQLFADFQTLLESVEANTTRTCCFSNTNITVVNHLFGTNEDPSPAIADAFGSYYTTLLVITPEVIHHRICLICTSRYATLCSKQHACMSRPAFQLITLWVIGLRNWCSLCTVSQSVILLSKSLKQCKFLYFIGHVYLNLIKVALVCTVFYWANSMSHIYTLAQSSLIVRVSKNAQMFMYNTGWRCWL